MRLKSLIIREHKYKIGNRLGRANGNEFMNLGKHVYDYDPMEEQWYRGVYLQPDGDERFFFKISFVHHCNAPRCDVIG